MKRKIFWAVFLSGILAISAPGLTQEEDDALEDSDAAVPEVRRGFSWEPGFTYRPGFPTERRMQEELGVSPEFDEEAEPSDGVTDPVPEETSPDEELGVSPEFDGEPLPPGAQREIELEEDEWATDPDSRIDPSDSLDPERTIQR